MKVLLKEVGKPCGFVEVGNTVEEIQTLIGGYFELVNLKGGLILLCDTDGKIKGLPWNSIVRANRGPTTICGTFFVCKLNCAEFAGFEDTFKDAISPENLAREFILKAFDAEDCKA